ncbi:MAG: AAA family ATPase [Vicinamibacteria bacterium]
MRNPFIAGLWVRGDNFFGRGELLREVLEGERESLWVVGARRLGKTSLLKELELRVQRTQDTSWAALYWDLEGSSDARGLADGLLDAVEDSESFRRATGVSIDEIEGMTVTDMLTSIVRKSVRSGWRLLLLIDEAEEFLTVARADAAVLPRLRRLFQRGGDLRCVLTSTRRLARIDHEAALQTSPFLQAFIPALYLTPLSPDETRALLARGRFSSGEVEEIIARTACHPFLVQLIASRLFENRDLAAILDQVGADEMVANFFSVDFQTLEAPERQLLEEVAREASLGGRDLAAALRRPEEAVAPLLFALTRMGYLAEAGDRYRLGNSFFERWLRRAALARAGEAGTAP